MSHIWMKMYSVTPNTLEENHSLVRCEVSVNGSRHTYEWAVAYVWMSHVTHMNEDLFHIAQYPLGVPVSCRLSNFKEWVTSHTSHITHVIASYHTYERRSIPYCPKPSRSTSIMSAIEFQRTSHITHKSYHTHDCIISHIWMKIYPILPKTLWEYQYHVG